jgi:hypothetical protein
MDRESEAAENEGEKKNQQNNPHEPVPSAWLSDAFANYPVIQDPHQQRRPRLNWLGIFLKGEIGLLYRRCGSDSRDETQFRQMNELEAHVLYRRRLRDVSARRGSPVLEGACPRLPAPGTCVQISVTRPSLRR